jgi:hypothetical protein
MSDSAHLIFTLLSETMLLRRRICSSAQVRTHHHNSTH